MARRRL